jgi:hexosaminidase
VEHLALGANIAYAGSAPYSDSYKAGGDKALIDGVCGGWTYTDKKWQGFIRDGVDVTIDLGAEMDITEVTAQFMQMCIPDVWFPAEVIISTSCDGNDFNELARIGHTVVRDEGLSFKEYGWKGETKARYINYRAKCGPQRGWLFTDEIIVR